jgi:hypothetical protein
MERYDGVAYRVIKKLQRFGKFPKDVDILIVSAMYGIIPHDKPIPNYNLRMTPERALEQAKENRTIMSRFLKDGCYRQVFISAGKDYLLSLEPFDGWKAATLVSTNRGAIGVQLRLLKDWLLHGHRTK